LSDLYPSAYLTWEALPGVYNSCPGQRDMQPPLTVTAQGGIIKDNVTLI